MRLIFLFTHFLILNLSLSYSADLDLNKVFKNTKNISFLQNAVLKISKCFSVSMSSKENARCATIHEELNRNETQEFREFFKNKIDIYCRFKDYKSCSINSEKYLDEFISTLYGKYIKTPEAFKYNEGSLYMGNIPCNVYRYGQRRSYIEVNKLAITCNKIKYIITIKDYMINSLKLRGFIYSEYSNNKRSIDNINFFNKWIKDQSDIVLADINKPTMCFKNSNDFQTLLQCIKKYDNYAKINPNRNFQSLYIGQLEDYCELLKIKKCDKEDKKLWYKYLKALYSAFFKKVKDIKECRIIPSGSGNSSNLEFSVDCTPISYPCEVKKFNTFQYKENYLINDIDIFTLDDLSCLKK